MSLYDLQQRTDAILKKYEKYDKPMAKRRETSGEDPFQDEYDAVEAIVEDLMRQTEEIAAEGNRAIVAARNAEIRKAKQGLLTDGIAAVQKKIKKGKGVNKAVIDMRQQKIKTLLDKIYAIPDGMGGTRRPYTIGTSVAGGKDKTAITLSTTGPTAMQGNAMYYQSSGETQKFEQEWEYSKKKQDMQLDRIEKGVATLGDMAKGMQEELDKQNPIIDDIDTQLNRVTSKLKNNNAKLKGLLTQMRSSRNICLDIILMCILLGIGAYLFTTLKKN